MKNTIDNICIDKLALCYHIHEDSCLHSITEEHNFIDFGDFQIQRIESKHFKNAFNILFKWDYDIDKGLQWHVFGQLKFAFHTDKDHRPEKAWIYLNNRILYTQFYPQTNVIIFSEYITDFLGMTLNNITDLEIAYDTAKNAPKAIKRELRNTDTTTILNGAVIDNRKKLIEEILYIHTGSLDRYKNMSLYIKQKDKDGFELKTYNKSHEISQSGKFYINEWHKVKPSENLYRIEVSLKNDHIKQYLHKNGIELTHLLFSDKQFLFDCFIHFANRLIRFRKNGNVHNVLEIL